MPSGFWEQVKTSLSLEASCALGDWRSSDKVRVEMAPSRMGGTEVAGMGTWVPAQQTLLQDRVTYPEL